MFAETTTSPSLPADLEVVLNGEKRRFATGFSLADVVGALGLPPDRVAIEFERQIVKRELWANTPISQGSEIEIVQFVGGG